MESILVFHSNFALSKGVALVELIWEILYSQDIRLYMFKHLYPHRALFFSNATMKKEKKIKRGALAIWVG